MSQSNYNMFPCSTIGCAGTTQVVIRKEKDDTFTARMGVALFGSTNMDDKGFEEAQYNPFHEKFYDNYVEGKGKTLEESIEAMKKDQKETSDALFY